MRRMTLNLGLRSSVYDALIPESHLPAGPYVPARDFPEVKHSPRWENLSPRVGAAYDLFGDGRTALKGGAGPLSGAQHGRRGEPPGVESAHEHDAELERREREFRPRLRSHNPLANGECGAWADLHFRSGQGRQYALRRRCARRLQPAELQLAGHRSRSSTSWRSNMGLTVAYFRTWYGGFQAAGQHAGDLRGLRSVLHHRARWTAGCPAT